MGITVKGQGERCEGSHVGCLDRADASHLAEIVCHRFTRCEGGCELDEGYTGSLCISA